MKELNYQLKRMCERNKDGSYSTQASRYKILQGIANQLVELGYRRMEAKSLKPKHVHALVTHYQKEQIAPSTIKNRLSILRWWAEKIGKRNVIAGDNSYYGIPERIFVTNSSKACELDRFLLEKIDNPLVKISLELQKAFGLRREEAIKFIPEYANQETHVRLKSTWCKGGKAREIPIRNDEQRDVLNRAHQLVGNASLIPQQYKYVDQLKRYEIETYKVGMSKLHGLRHRYAQIRYEELTGWRSPACGGPVSKELTGEQRTMDQVARLAISQELGHERIQVTGVYLGK